MSAFDVEQVRADFPALHQEVHGRPLVFLDNAASSQKPRVVLDRLRDFYERENANVHRGVHVLSQRATEAYEGARGTVRTFLNARQDSEIVFVRGTTEGINLVAQTIGRQRLKAGSEVVLTGLEHHSNIVPWQLICQQTGASLRVVPVEPDGSVSLQKFSDALSEKTAFVSVIHYSNALGTKLPVKEMVALARRVGAPVLVDAAQSTPHGPVDVQDLDCDFLVFSGHKVYAPSGIGVLYGRAELLAEMPPYQGGGDMIETVSFSGSTWAAPPARFEAGTPNFGGAAALGAALEYLMALDTEGLRAHEADLVSYGHERLASVPGLRILGTADKVPVFSMVMDGIHPHDIGTLLDRQGVAVRTGHHCAQPLMAAFEVPATTRASCAFYNTRGDIDALVAALEVVKEMFG